jgi:crotonobetainyl-CoA:carnitine CoA-transferase CaiB-like acyl-CoA transferase
MPEKELPYAGIRVVEFTHMVMGPTCGMVLADLGAEVIKVEPHPAGDNTRRCWARAPASLPCSTATRKAWRWTLQTPRARRPRCA